MLYGSHVFARAKVIPDLALAKGREAHRYAQGDRRSEPRVPGRRRDRDGRPRPRRPRRGEGVDRPRGGGRHRAPEPAPRAPARDVAGDRGCGRRATPRGCARIWSARCSMATDSGLPAARCEALAAPRGRVGAAGGTRGRRGADGARGAVGGRGVGALPRRSPVTLRGAPRPTRRARRVALARGSRRGDDLRPRRGGRRSQAAQARGPAPRRPAAGRADPDGDRRARVGGGRAPVRPGLPRR